jgi:hypothetical protein
MHFSNRFRVTVISLALAAAIGSAPAIAGEVTGNGTPIDVNGRSECAYSGRNDNTPDPRDPGGRTQNYGTLVGQFDWIDPQDLDPNAPYFQPIPGYACNPNRGRDLHAGN